MKVLVTGAAGFIGFHLSRRLLEEGWEVVGVDNLNDYYPVALKRDRIALIDGKEGFRLEVLDLADAQKVAELFAREKFDRVIHLAAQAGVRYSIDNPRAYIDANVIGYFNVLEGCRHTQVPHLVFASSSSVYGLNTKMPYAEGDNVDHPISLYAATKKGNELMAHTYAHLFGIPCTGLRFFTVYGPWGRPDMAYSKFCRAIAQDKPLQLYNYGDMSRDFTYIDDIVDGVMRVVDHLPEPNSDWSGDHPDPGSAAAPFRIYNIGAGRPESLQRFLDLIEEYMGKKAIVEKVGMQPGDVNRTFADIQRLQEATGYSPKTTIEEGLRNYVAWFREYYLEGGRL